MRDKRGMRDKGPPENTRTKRTKGLSVRLRDLWVPCAGELTRRWRVLWRPGAESGIGGCKLELTKRTEPAGRLPMPWMTRSREWRVNWIGIVFLDTQYRCEIGKLCRVNDVYFFDGVRYGG
jgi:hypothetical protein